MQITRESLDADIVSMRKQLASWERQELDARANANAARGAIHALEAQKARLAQAEVPVPLPEAKPNGKKRPTAVEELKASAS